MGTFVKRQPRLATAIRESGIPLPVLSKMAGTILWERIAETCGTPEELAMPGFRSAWDEHAARAFLRLKTEGRRLRLDRLVRYFMESWQADFDRRAARAAQ